MNVQKKAQSDDSSIYDHRIRRRASSQISLFPVFTHIFPKHLHSVLPTTLIYPTRIQPTSIQYVYEGESFTSFLNTILDTDPTWPMHTQRSASDDELESTPSPKKSRGKKATAGASFDDAHKVRQSTVTVLPGLN